MGVLKVDYNRPLIKKAEAKTGIEVFMYLDTPGVYLNSYELPVSESLAEAAGFDTAKYGKMRKRRELMALAKKGIEEQLALEEENDVKEVVQERGGFSIVHIGLGRHVIEDPDGGQIVANHLTLAEAEAALNQLVPQDQEAPKPGKPSPFWKAAPVIKNMEHENY